MATCKNYHVQGGEKWVVEGVLNSRRALLLGLTATAAADSEAWAASRLLSGRGDTGSARLIARQTNVCANISRSAEIPVASAERWETSALSRAPETQWSARLMANKQTVCATYPEVPEIPVAENQATSVAATTEELVTDFNTLLAALKQRTDGSRSERVENEPPDEVIRWIYKS